MKSILNIISTNIVFIKILLICQLLSSCSYLDNFASQDSKLESFTKKNEIQIKEKMTNKLASSTVIINRKLEYSSGVIIGKEELGNINKYFVLTTGHSVEDSPSEMSIPEYEDINNICPNHHQGINNKSELTCDSENYYLTTIDNNVYLIDYPSIIKYSEKLDLALLEFTSHEDYRVAPIASIQKVSKGEPVFISGYRGCNNKLGLEMKDMYQLTSGYVKKEVAKSSDIFYTNSTIWGMSGAGVFNQQGKLIAIHKKASRKKQYNDIVCQSLEIEDSELGDNWGTMISKEFIEENIPDYVKTNMKECTGIAQNSFC